MDLVLYIHGKGGSAAESAHYKPLFPDCDVLGLTYQMETPQKTGAAIRAAVCKLKADYASVTLIANSIGAFYSMYAGIDDLIQKAFFISPIVDMERLISGLMDRAQVTPEALQTQGVIHTAFGEDLSWAYWCEVRAQQLQWRVPTEILYGRQDELTDYETIAAFAKRWNANLTVMETGAHWFHTAAQMRFLDDWIQTGSAVKK